MIVVRSAESRNNIKKYPDSTTSGTVTAQRGGILIVDDNKNVLTALRILLENYFESITLLSSPKQIHTLLREAAPDIVLLDMNFSAGINSGNEGLYWLSEIKKQDADLPVVLFTAYADIDLAVKALKLGATDFVVKPWNNAKLIATLQAAYSLRESRNNVKQLRERQSVLNSELNKGQTVCWGISEAVRNLRLLIEKVARTDANILITGENGTGKEVIAREIQRLSLRNKEILITVDMGAVTESLFESELFGHVKGSFTDAKTDRTGKFEAANHGTLFLDEIGNLSYPLQAKLLNALQSRQIVRVGGNKPIPVDIRLICATNRDLRELVGKGEFREDLLYRINTIQIEIPPLRERKEDIPPLAEFFLEKYAKKYNKKNISFSPSTLNKLQAYHWPGNIRELQHTVEKTVILSETNVLQINDIYLSPSNPANIELDNMTLEDAEKILIQNSLKRNRENLSAVAAELGITRPTLYSKMRKYHLVK
ncbi:MAG: sigma-54 dependent transcriptional regulator [Tannerella sp.]|jgi:DNA-binding NtrC family response regulator|nr:sigma-54 dependent transcriptional regulator [Tannerella sp.]